MSLYEEARSRLNDAVARLQACSAQRPQPDPTALQRAQAGVQHQIQELRRAALVALAAKGTARVHHDHAGTTASIAGDARPSLAVSKAKSQTAKASPPPRSVQPASTHLPPVQQVNGGGSGASRRGVGGAAAAETNADARRGVMARDGELYRRGDLLHLRGTGAGGGPATAKKAAPHHRQGSPAASMPAPPRSGVAARLTATTPPVRALTPTPPRPTSSSSLPAGSPSRASPISIVGATVAEGGDGVMQFESTLAVVSTCLSQASHTMEGGLRQEASTLFLRSLSADVERLRTVVDAVVVPARPTGTGAAKAQRSPSARALVREAPSGRRLGSGSSQASGEADAGEHSWTDLFGNTAGDGGGGDSHSAGQTNFIIEVDDGASRRRRRSDAFHPGIPGKHVPLEQLPLALRAYYAVMQYDMLATLLAFHKVLDSDPHTDAGPAVLRQCVGYVEQMVRCISGLASAPPLRAGREEVRSSQPSQPPLTHVGTLTVKELLAVREALTDDELQRLLGVHVSFSNADLPPVRIDYKVDENGYFLIFTGTVYVYEMVQRLLQRAQSLQRQLEHRRGGAADQCSAAELEAAAVAGASLSSTAVSEDHWVESVVSALMRASSTDGAAPSSASAAVHGRAADARRAPRSSALSVSAQLDQLFLACTVALAQCIDICEGQSSTLVKLATTKYLGWRVHLYEALAQAYEWRGQYSEALAIVKRMARKTKELVALEFYDPVPPPAEWHATLETALQRCGLDEMKYTWYAFIAMQHAFESERCAQAVLSSGAPTVTSSDILEGGGGGGTEAGPRGGSRGSSSEARHRSLTAGVPASAAGTAGTTTAANGCPVVVSENGAVVTEASLPRSGAALLAEIWRSLCRHPLPQPGTKGALDEEASKLDGSTPGSPTTIPSTTKSKRKNSLARRASTSSTGGPTSPPPPVSDHRKDAMARQEAQAHQARLRQFAAQALTFLVSFLVKQSARTESLEQMVVTALASGGSGAGTGGVMRGKAPRTGNASATAAAVVAAPPPAAAGAAPSATAVVVSFAHLRQCAREALEIVCHCLSAQAVALSEPCLRGALLGAAGQSTHCFPLGLPERWSLEDENVQLMETIGAQIHLAMAKAAAEEEHAGEIAAAAAAGGHGAGKNQKKVKSKGAASASSGATASSVTGAPPSGSSASGATRSDNKAAAESADRLTESPTFISALSLQALFPQLVRLAQWDHLESVHTLRAAAASVESANGCTLELPGLRLPTGKSRPTAQSALSLTEESPLEKEVVLLLRLYSSLFPTACHAMYIRTGAVLIHLLHTCRAALTTMARLQQGQQTTTTTAAGNGAAPMPTSTSHLLESVETAVRLLQQLHMSVLVTHRAAESCCTVNDVLLTGPADLRVVGLPRWLASAQRHTEDGALLLVGSSDKVAVEEAAAVVRGPSALLFGLLLSVRDLVAVQAAHAVAQASLFRPLGVESPSAVHTGETEAYPLCTPLLAPAELLRQLASAVGGGAVTASWPVAPILASTVDMSYACAALFERTLFVAADLILHEATRSIAGRRDARRHREQLGLLATPFHDPTPALVRPPAPSSPSPRTEEEADEQQEVVYTKVVMRTVEAFAATGAVDPVRLGRLVHTLADAALQDMESAQRTTGQPDVSAADRGAEANVAAAHDSRLTRQQKGKSRRHLTGTAKSAVGETVALPVYPREQRLQSLLERARLAHAFTTIAEQLIARRADVLEGVRAAKHTVKAASVARETVPEADSPLTQLRHALEDTNTDLTRTAAQLQWHVALLRSQVAAYAQHQEDIQTLLARQLHSDVYGVASAKETRILAALLDEEPDLPQSAEAAEARLISSCHGSPLKSAVVLLALATVTPKPASAQRELLGKAFDVLTRFEADTATHGSRGGGERSQLGKKKAPERPATAGTLFSRLMVWGYAASTSAKLGVVPLANTARGVLYAHYVGQDTADDGSGEKNRVAPPMSLEEELRTYRLVPCVTALQSCSVGALSTLCRALLDLSAMELSSVSASELSPQPGRRRAPMRTCDEQKVGLRCAYRLLLALQLLAMRQAEATGDADNRTTAATSDARNGNPAEGGGGGVGGKSASRSSRTAGTKSKTESATGTSEMASAPSSVSSRVPAVAVVVTDPLTLQCANEMLNALLLVLEDEAFCHFVVAPLVALCHVILGIRSALVWSEASVQLFAIRVLNALRDTLDRVRAQKPTPHQEGRASDRGGDRLDGFKVEDLVFLLHRTFAHAWNAVYANPTARQQRFAGAVAAESSYARYVVNTKDGVPPPPPGSTAAPTAMDEGPQHRGRSMSRDEESAAQVPAANTAGASEGGEGHADDVFTFAGAQYAPAPAASFVYDTMPIEYLELLEQLLLCQGTPEAVQNLLHPRPIPPPPRLPPLPQPAAPTSGADADAQGKVGSAAAAQRNSMQAAKKGAVAARRVSSQSAASQQRRRRGLSADGSTASLTEHDAASVADGHAAQQRAREAAARDALTSQLRERLRIQADYAVVCRLGDTPLQGLPDILTQLAEALAQEAAAASAALSAATSAAPSSVRPATEILERFSQDPLQTRLAVCVVKFYLCHGHTRSARAAAEAALSHASAQWTGMKTFAEQMLLGLRQWHIDNGFVLSDRSPFGGQGGHGGEDSESSLLEDEHEGGDRVQPGGASRSRSGGAKGKAAAANAKKANAGKKKGAAPAKGRGGVASKATGVGVDDGAGDGEDEGPDPRFTSVPRVWTAAEQLMLKQVTRSLTWMRRRRVLTWLTRRFFQFNGPAQAQLRMYMAFIMCMDKDRSEEMKGAGGTLVSLANHMAQVAAQNEKGASDDGFAALGGLAEQAAARDASARSTTPAAAAAASGANSSKGKRAQLQQAENDAALAQRAREEHDNLELFLTEHCLRAARLFNQAFLPARAVGAVATVVNHLRQCVCPQLPDAFLLAASDPFLEPSATDTTPFGRRRSELPDDDGMSAYTSSVWGGAGGASAVASVDVAHFLPSVAVDKLRQLAPSLVALAKELLCAVATVVLGYCDHRRDLELTQPSAIKIGPYVCLSQQLHFQGVIPSLYVCASAAGEFEEARHTVLAQLAHTRYAKQLQRRLGECMEMEQTTRILVIEAWKTELLAKVDHVAQQASDAGQEGAANVWFDLANTVRTCSAAWGELDLLSPTTRARRARQVDGTASAPPRMVLLDTAAITGVEGGGGAAQGAAADTGGAGRRRAGPPTSTLIYFPFETPMLRRQLWTDAAPSTAAHAQSAGAEDGAPTTAVSRHALRLGEDMSEPLFIEGLLYLVRAVQFTHRKEAVQLCLAANALTSGRYATALLPLVMTVQAAIGVPSTAELIRAYQLARTETPVGVALLETARRSWQRYQFTGTFQRVRQRLVRSLLPSLRHFEDPSHANAAVDGGGLPGAADDGKKGSDGAPTMRGAFDARGGGGGASSLRVSLRSVVAQYEAALAALRKNRDFALVGECLSEMGEIYLLHRSRSEAEMCWCDAVDALLETPRSLHTWRTAPCEASRLTVTRVLLAVSSLSSLAMYIYRDHQRQAVEACVLAASLVDRLLVEVGISAMLPERAFDYADYTIVGLHRALKYLDLPLRQPQVIQRTVHHLLHVAHTLLDFDYAVHASLVSSLAEFLAHRFAKHWVMVVEARLLRARAAAKSGHFTAAFNVLRTVCLGESLPDAALALAPLGAVRDSVVAGHHFVRSSRGGGAGGASEGKKAGRQQSNAGTGGGQGGEAVPGPVDGLAHPSIIAAIEASQYRNDEVPSSSANVDYVTTFVAACLPNFSTLCANASAVAVVASSTSGTNSSGSSGVPVLSTADPTQCLNVCVAELFGPLLAPRVVLAVAEVLVSLGSREGVYLWGQGVVGDVAAAVSPASRPGSARSAAAAAAAVPPTAVESGAAVVVQHPTACTVALQVAEPILDWFRHEPVSLSALPLTGRSGAALQGSPSSSRGAGAQRTLSSANAASARGNAASTPSTSAGLVGGADGSTSHVSHAVQQQRLEEAAMVRHHATLLRAKTLEASGRLRQAIALLETHMAEFNELAVPAGGGAEDHVDRGAGAPADGPSGTVRGPPTLVRHASSKGGRGIAAAEVATTFPLVGKGFEVSTVMCTPSYLITIGHTHWCRVYACLAAAYFGLRRFQAMEAVTQHALTLCDQCGDPYSSRLFLLYRCAALAQRGNLDEAAQTARQLHSVASALSFAPYGLTSVVPSAVAASADGGPSRDEALAEQVWRLAVPCAHGVAAADSWGASTLLVQHWLQRAVAQQDEQQRGLAMAASPDGGTEAGSRSAGRRKGAYSDMPPATAADRLGETEQSVSTALARAVCALAASAFFHGVAPWAARTDVRTSQSLPQSRQRDTTSASPCRARWVIAPHAGKLAWSSASLAQLHRAMNVYAAAFITPSASRKQIGRAVSVLTQVLEGVVPQYDTRAHPSDLTVTKLLLARATLHAVDWSDLVYSTATASPSSAAAEGGSEGVAVATAGRPQSGSVRPSSSSARASLGMAPGVPATATAHDQQPLFFFSAAEAIAALPCPAHVESGASHSSPRGAVAAVATSVTIPRANAPARGALQCAAALLFQVVEDSVHHAVHDYAVLRTALLELARLFARVGAESRAAKSAASRGLPAACAPVAASCTILAMLLGEMQANVFDRTRAFTDYVTDEANMVVPLSVLERALPQRVVATVEVAARQLGALHGDVDVAAGASTVPVSTFYQATAGESTGGRLGDTAATMASGGSTRRAVGAGSTAATGAGVAESRVAPLPNLVHAFATLHREQRLTAVMPASEALDREAALVALRAFLQSKTVPTSCVYLCYGESTRHAHAVAIASGAGGSTNAGGVGFGSSTTGGGGIGNSTRRPGGGGGGGTNLAAQQRQELVDVWGAMLPPVLLSGSVEGYLTSAGPQLLGAPSINAVVAACFQSVCDGESSRTHEGSSGNELVTLLLAVSPFHDDELTQAPSLSTQEDRKRLLRGCPTFSPAAGAGQGGAGADRVGGRSGRAGSAHSADGLGTRRRGSSRQGALSRGAQPSGGPRDLAGVAAVGDGRSRPLMMDALLAERIDVLAAATASADDDVDIAAAETEAARTTVSSWSCLALQLPLDGVRQLHTDVRRVLQRQAELVECQRRVANLGGGADAGEKAALAAVGSPGLSPVPSSAFTRKSSVSRLGAQPGLATPVVAPDEPDQLASGTTQLHAALAEATNALRAKATHAGTMGSGFGSAGTSGANGGGTASGSGTVTGGGGGGGGARQGTRRSPSSHAAASAVGGSGGETSAHGSFGAGGSATTSEAAIESRVHDLARAEEKERDDALQATLESVTESLDEAKSTFVMGFVELLVRANVARALADEALMEACVAQLLPECAVTPALFAFFEQWFAAAAEGASSPSADMAGSGAGMRTAFCFFQPGLNEWMRRVTSLVTEWREEALVDV